MKQLIGILFLLKISVQFCSAQSCNLFSLNHCNGMPRYDYKTANLIIIASDIDNDGKKDIVYSDDSLVWLRNLATGIGSTNTSFSTKKPLLQINFGDLFTVADINNDGKDDIIICDGSNINVYLNTTTLAGNATFTNAYSIVIANNNAVTEIAIADVNNDGRKDINLCDVNQVIHVLVNSFTASTITFGATTITAITTTASTNLGGNFDFKDINKDGFVDFVFLNNNNNTVSCYFNNGLTGVISWNNIYNYSSSNMLAYCLKPIQLHDVDGDGIDDITLIGGDLLSNNVYFYSFLIYKNNSIALDSISLSNNGSLQPMSFNLFPLRCGCKLDLITEDDGVTTDTDHVHMYLNTSTPGKVVFLAPCTHNITSDNFTGADFDNDGKIDIASLCDVCGSNIPGGFGSESVDVLNNEIISTSFDGANLQIIHGANCSKPTYAYLNVEDCNKQIKYSWQSPLNSSSDTVFNLLPGNYSVIVSSNSGCDTTINFVVSPSTSNGGFNIAHAGADVIAHYNTSVTLNGAVPLKIATSYSRGI